MPGLAFVPLLVAPGTRGRALVTSIAIANAILFGSSFVVAEDQPAPPKRPADAQPATILPEVQVTGLEPYGPDSLSLRKYTQPLLTTPKSATVIPKDLMEEQGVTTLRDSLRNVSGISIGAGEGSYQGDNFSIRGFGARSDIFLDGMSDFGSYNRDPFNLESIEVLKGPSSAEFGRGSSGGVVNMESKTPKLEAFVAGSMTYSSNHGEAGTLDINQPIKELPGAAFRLNLMGHHSDVAGRDETSYTRWGIAPSLAFGIGMPNRLTISYLHQSEDNVPDYGIPWLNDRPAPVNRNNFYGFSSDYMKTDVDIGTIKFEHDFNDNFTLREQFRMANYRRNFRVTEADASGILPGTPPLQMQVERDMIDGISTDRVIDEDINLLSKFDTGPVGHTLVTGFEFIRQSNDPRRIEPNWVNVPNTGLLYPTGGDNFTGTGTVGTLAHGAVNTLSAYLIDTMKFGKKWSFTGGLRYDRISASYDEAVTATQYNTLDNLFSWRAALVYQPAPNGSIYFSSGTSNHPNSAQLAVSSETVLPANAGNLGIGRNLELELGTKWELFNKRLSFTSALFWDQETNPASVDLDDPLIEVLHGKERNIGFEFGAVGRLTDKWRVMLNYTYQKSKITASSDPTLLGNPMLNTPKNTVALWTTYDLPLGFQVGAGLNGVSSRTGSESPDPANGLLMEAPGYLIYSAMLKYRLTKNVNLQANVTNLTNKYYFDGVHPGHVVPGEGRVVSVGVNFKF
jgi:catecholate siderophore receptor